MLRAVIERGTIFSLVGGKRRLGISRGVFELLDRGAEEGVCPFMEDERCSLHDGCFPCSGRWFQTCTVYMRSIKKKPGPKVVKDEENHGTGISNKLLNMMIGIHIICRDYNPCCG